jgi:hypothetical protein
MAAKPDQSGLAGQTGVTMQADRVACSRSGKSGTRSNCMSQADRSPSPEFEPNWRVLIEFQL